MISRLSAFAALFSVLATLLVVFTSANVATAASAAPRQVESAAMPVYQLERVIVTGKRVASAE